MSKLLDKFHSTLDPVQRLRTRAHVNRSFVASAELGALGDPDKSADFLRGRAAAFDEAAEIIEALGLTLEWSDDIAGPDWQRYSRWVGKTTNHPGPNRIAAGLD